MSSEGRLGLERFPAGITQMWSLCVVGGLMAADVANSAEDFVANLTVVFTRDVLTLNISDASLGHFGL